MSTEASKRISVTLSITENDEIEQAAITRGVAISQIIRERLAEWKEASAPLPQTSAPTVLWESERLFFKEFMARVDNLEQQTAATQKMVQQILQEDIPGSNGIELTRFLTRMERLEGILDGIHVLVERIAREVTTNPEAEETIIREIQTGLEEFLATNQ
jgi:hypothetical protein